MALSDLTKTKLKVALGSPDAQYEMSQAIDVGTDELGRQSAVVTLTSAQILALFTTPITLVAAPGAGKVIVVDSVFATMTYNSAAYATNAAGFLVRYTDASGASVGATLTQGFLQSSANAMQSVAAAATALTPVENSPIVIHAGSANPTTGNSPLKVRVWYRVVPNPLA